MGFDLCAACYERRADVVGRFNQHHKAGAEHVPRRCYLSFNAASFPLLYKHLLRAVAIMELLIGYVHAQITG